MNQTIERDMTASIKKILGSLVVPPWAAVHAWQWLYRKWFKSLKIELAAAQIAIAINQIFLRVFEKL
jgi:hypothetical protein